MGIPSNCHTIRVLVSCNPTDHVLINRGRTGYVPRSHDDLGRALRLVITQITPSEFVVPTSHVAVLSKVCWSCRSRSSRLLCCRPPSPQGLRSNTDGGRFVARHPPHRTLSCSSCAPCWPYPMGPTAALPCQLQSLHQEGLGGPGQGVRAVARTSRDCCRQHLPEVSSRAPFLRCRRKVSRTRYRIKHLDDRTSRLGR